MRNKIRQLMKKEEGFTLVELLAVIVILGIILAIAIPSIGGVINTCADTDANEAEE
ncbi:MAG: type II secretion system protein [Alkalibacterium sp.]|nr:type II secretion system protein [Alkalibacterium sp.]